MEGNKRITLADVAKEAGVSAATVSYVLNYSQTEKISHETRLKVFTAARKLKYVPNISAKTLSGKRNMTVGIIIGMEEDEKNSKLYQYYDLSREIQRLLNDRGYDAFFITTKEMEQNIAISKRKPLDAVFVMDMNEEMMRAIAKQYFVPTIFIDGYMNDPIFCKILADPSEILEKAREQLGEDFYVVMEDYSDKNFLDTVINRVGEENVFVNRLENDLILFLQRHKDQKGLVVGAILGLQVEQYVDNHTISVVIHADQDIALLPDTTIIIVSNKQKAQKAVEVMERMILLEETDEVEVISCMSIR